MPKFTESNITLDFPDGNFFRFSSCAGYKALSGNHFKEMDACWYDAGSNVYWLMELKDYSSASLTASDTIEQKSWDMVKKAIDSICMFLASKHCYPYAVNLNPCFPFVPDDHTKFNVVTIVHCDRAQKPDSICLSVSTLVLVSFLNRPLASINWVVVSVLCLDSTKMVTAMVVQKNRFGASEITVST